MDKILLNAGPSTRGWHRVESFLRCPQLYAYEKVLNYQWPTSPPLVKGSLVHLGLAHWYARRREDQQGGDREKYYTANEAMEIGAKEWGELGAEWLPLAKRALAAYAAKWSTEKHKVLMVEEEVRADIWVPKLSRSVLFTQRVDLVAEAPDGKVYFWDHKTGFRSGKQMTTRYILSGQFHGIRWFGGQMFGDRFGGIILNQIGLGIGEIKLGRPAIPPAPNMTQCFPDLLADAEASMAELEREKRDPWEWPKAASEQVCMTPYGKCPAFALCQWGKAGLTESGAKEKAK